ncbi:MAG: hypothetical protein AUJ51_04670 [Elusimicrobia bacterium CG1_02_56_21]|nr:MAG: hypothetical protein AUJ51_04670 [Elusimicrobia bacterium CG1_02_56_21]
MRSEISADSLRDVVAYVKGSWEYQAIFAVMAAALVIGLAHILLERLRIKKLKAMGERFGLLYEKYPLSGLDLRGLGPGLFKSGDFSSKYNGLKDISVLPGAWYLDYQYAVRSRGSRGGSTYSNFGLAMFRSSGLSLPGFELSPETMLGRAGDLIVKRDIDLPGYPAFSRRYALTGPDRERVISLFSPALTGVFERLKADWSVQASGNCVIAFRKGYVSAGDYPAFIEEARIIFRAFLDDPRNKAAGAAAGPGNSPDLAEAASGPVYSRAGAEAMLAPGQKTAEIVLLIIMLGFALSVVYAFFHG